MNASTAGASFAIRLDRVLVKLAWQAVRVVLLAVLLTLEPLVWCMLSVLALVSVLTAFFFELSGVVPDFPFWLIVGFAVGCTLVLMVYEHVIHVLVG